jgi:hypothetical protein
MQNGTMYVTHHNLREDDTSSPLFRSKTLKVATAWRDVYAWPRRNQGSFARRDPEAKPSEVGVGADVDAAWGPGASGEVGKDECGGGRGYEGEQDHGGG